MNAHINFEDNIFILNTRIRMMRDLLLLDAEPDFFLEQTLNDAEFINQILTALLEQLSGNVRYIEREEQFHNLSETESAYMAALSGILNGTGAISAARFPAIRDRLTLLHSASRDRQDEIDEISCSAADGSATEPLVSSDELSELLKDME
jgi:hypothetical protein